MIDNFSTLPDEEVEQLAREFIEKINTSNVLSDEFDLLVVEVETNEMDGSLNIFFGADDIDMNREGTWTAAKEENADELPSIFDNNLEYTGDTEDEVGSCFKTLEAELEGYKLEVSDLRLDDYTESHVAEVTNVTQEDAGIGRYEFWGAIGYDSNPYVSVEGKIACTCDISGWLTITAM